MQFQTVKDERQSASTIHRCCPKTIFLAPIKPEQTQKGLSRGLYFSLCGHGLHVEYSVGLQYHLTCDVVERTLGETAKLKFRVIAGVAR
jgi:hypothetical protein